MEATYTSRGRTAKTEGANAPSARSAASAKGAPAGMPAFLQRRLDPAPKAEEREAPAQAQDQPPLQRRCATCGFSGAPCPTCEEERLQKKEAGGSTALREPGAMRATARDGLDRASQPLPHLERIQRSFGRHDVSDVRTQVGGPARDASERMGAVGYTMGDRVGFHGPPDERTAAHEAAHVVQQRDGLRLEGGVGQPGDIHERKADAAADAVVEGRSAEKILDGAGGGASGSADEAPVQHQLQVDATRLFEPPVVSSRPQEGGAGSTPGAGGESAKDVGSKDAGSGDASEGPTDNQPKEAGTGAGTTPDAGAPAPAPTGTPAAAPGSAAPAGPAANTEQQPCKGGGGATCYKEPVEDPPAQTEQEKPADPEPTKAKEEGSGTSPDVPEPDNCPVQQAVQEGAPSSASQPAGGGGPDGSAAPSGGGAPPTAVGSPTATAKSTASSGGQGGGGASGGAAAPTGDAPDAGGSPFDAQISTAEADRDSAVERFASSSTGLSEAGQRVQELRGGVEFKAKEGSNNADRERRDQANGRAGRFFSAIADQLDQAVGVASGPVPERIGAQAETWKAAIASSMEAQKATISARVETARGEARARAGAARRRVLSLADAAVLHAQIQTAAAIETLRAAHTKTLGQVGELETTTLDRVNTIYATGRTTHENLGTTVGDEAVAVGEEYVAGYERCKINRDDSFWAGRLTDRRAEAQQNAARETAKGFRKGMVESAQKRAREVVKEGRKNDRCSIIAAARTARTTLDQQLAGVITALEANREANIQQAGSTRDSLLSGIDAALTATLSQLDRQEHEQRQTADDTGYMQQVMLEQSAHAAAAGLQRSVAEAIDQARGGLASVQAQLATATAPDLEQLERALAAIQTLTGGAIDGLNSATEGGASAAEAQLNATGSAALVSLEAITRGNEEKTQSAEASFATSMRQMASSATTTFKGLREGLSNKVKEGVSGGTSGLAAAVDGMRQVCTTTTSQAETALGKSAKDLEKSLRENKAGLDCEIPKRATEAASKEAPAWKKVLAVVLIIVVIVIVIAVTILTAGGTSILAGIVIGAIVGAVTSGLLKVASNLWNNQSWTQGVGEAVLVGAITGAIGGGLGGGAGTLFKTESVLGQLGIALGVAAVMDLGTQLVMNKGDFGKISWGQFAVTLAITIATFGIAKAFAPKPVGAPKPGASERNTTTPHEEPISTPKENAPTTTPKEEVPVSTPKEEPPVSTPKEEPPVSTPKEEPPVSTPKEEPPVSTPKEEPPVSTPKEESPVSSPKEKAPTTMPAEETPPTTQSRTENVDPKKLKFSQKDIAPTTGDGKMTLEQLTESMRTGGWKGDPIDVVKTQDGMLSIDNRRVTAAQNAELPEIPARIHEPTEPFPTTPAEKFMSFKLKQPIRMVNGKLVVGGTQGEIVYPKGALPSNYGEAGLFRTANQGNIQVDPGKGTRFPLGGRYEQPSVRGR